LWLPETAGVSSVTPARKIEATYLLIWVRKVHKNYYLQHFKIGCGTFLTLSRYLQARQTIKPNKKIEK